jgi:predicted transcriptional regulator
MNATTKTDRGKTQIEITTETRRKLRMLAALTDQQMHQAADEAISRRLAEVQAAQAGETSS